MMNISERFRRNLPLYVAAVAGVLTVYRLWLWGVVVLIIAVLLQDALMRKR